MTFFQKIKNQKTNKKTILIIVASVILVGFWLFKPSDVFGITYTLTTDTDKTIHVHNDLIIGDGLYELEVTASTTNPIIDIDGNVTINASTTLIAATSSPFTIAGDWSNSGTFTHNNGTTTFDGTGTSTFSGVTTFYNLISTTANKILEFTAGTAATTTVAGNLTLDGGACDTQIKLRSTSVSSYWYFNVLGSAGVDYADIQDSNATGSASAIIATNSEDSGHNDNWSITTGLCGAASPLTASGTVYTNEGTTTIAEGKTIRIKVNGAGDYSTTTASGGTYYIDTVEISSAGDVVTAYIDGETENAVTITRANDTTSNIQGLDLYQNYIIVRHEDEGPLTIDDLDKYDQTEDDDIPFTANATADTLTASSTAELFVWSGDTFSTGGAGGSIYLNDVDINGTFTATSTQTIYASSTWDATGGTFNSASSTVEFTSTATSTTITSNSSSFHNLTFNGSGGTWTLQDALDVNGAFSLTNGTTTGAADHNINIAGDTTLSLGTIFTKASGTGKVIFDGDLTYQDNTSPQQNLGDVEIGTSPDTTNLSSNMTADSLTINSGDVLNTRGYDLDITEYITVNGTLNASDTLAGNATLINLGTNWTVANATGNFVHATSTVTFDETTSSTLNSGGTTNNFDFYNLSFTKSSTATTTLSSYGIKVLNNFNISNSNSILDVSSSNYGINVGGNYTNSGKFEARNGTTTFDGTTEQTLSGTMTGTSAFYGLSITNNSGSDPVTSPSLIFGNAASSTSLYVTTDSTKLRFQASTGYTFTNFHLNGQGTGTRVQLRSSTTSTPWKLYVTGTQSVLNTDVKDSDASGGDEIDATDSSNLNSAGNTNWLFGGDSLSFSISDNTIGFAALTSGAVRFATGDKSLATEDTEAHTLTASTTASDGYTITVRGATLTSGGNTITAIGDTAATSSPGTKQFGIRVVSSGGSGTAAAPYNDAADFAYNATAQTTDVIATCDSSSEDTVYSMRYMGNITSNTEAGDYSTVITYVITANF